MGSRYVRAQLRQLLLTTLQDTQVHLKQAGMYLCRKEVLPMRQVHFEHSIQLLPDLLHRHGLQQVIHRVSVCMVAMACDCRASLIHSQQSVPAKSRYVWSKSDLQIHFC